MLKAKLSDREMVVKYVRASKLNTLTLFDLDKFIELCITVSNADVEYPPFYYEDLQLRASFG